MQRPLRLAALLWIATACTASPARREGAPPNVLILYTDDQGYGDCGAYNDDPRLQTPNLDRLAAEGMRFLDAHSSGSVCTPSRYGLLTGRYAWRTERGDVVLGADAEVLIEPGRVTLASLLRDHGYRTAAVGKWHLGMRIPGTKGNRDWTQPVEDGPLQRGFDEFYGIPASMNFGVLTWFDGAHAVEPATLWTRKKFPASEIETKPFDYRMAPPFDEERLNKSDIEVAPGFRDVDALAIIAEHAVAFLERAAEQPDQPFFLYVPFTSPHLPHCTAPDFQGRTQLGNYGDFLLETDARIGAILSALDRGGLSENTLVVFSSDNGPENNRADWQRIYGHDPSGGFRGGKRDLYEGGHRVPLLVRWPNVVRPGSSFDGAVGQVDLLRTVADALGAELPRDAGEDSVSFLPALRGEEHRREVPLVHRAGKRAALRSGRYKLHRYPGKDGDGRRLELYDLDSDPGERENLAGHHPERVEDLERRLEQLLGHPDPVQSSSD
ncbi:MAG: arylsulfatase [Planctomycetota bacterium]